MDAALQAYDDAWRNTPANERNSVCQVMADDYVLAHPELAARYGGLTIPELVALVDVAREAGNEERRIELDIWINHRFEYQQIGGAIAIGGTIRSDDLPSINADGDHRQAGG